ncbi:MAG: hypothetical protein ACYDAI_18040 [Trichloromonadaceae bacterium]
MRKYTYKLVVLLTAASLALAGCGGGGGGGTAAAPAGVDAPGGIVVAPIENNNPAPTPENPAPQPGVFALPAAINNNNQIVGTAEAVLGGLLKPAFWQVDDLGATTVAPSTLAALVADGFAAAFGLNNDGVIVGVVGTATVGINRAAVWANKDASPTQLPLLAPFSLSAAYGISPSGRIVGTAENADLLLQAVRWERAVNGSVTGPFLLPGVPGGWESEAYAINDDDTIAGELIDAEGISRAVLWRFNGTSYDRVDLTAIPGFANAVAFGLNSPAAGQPLLVVVGEVSDDGLGGETHAARWSVNGASITAADLGNNNRGSSAAAINTAGLAVGYEESGTDVQQASTWAIPTLKSILIDTDSQAFGVNDNNLVVGRSASQGFVKRVN